MIKYAGWIFDSIEKGSKNEEHGAKTYGPDYQWDGKIHMNDLTQRPQSSDTLTDEVDHLIRNNLRREKSLLKPGDVDGIKLRIPMDWAEMKEQEKPPFYQVPARYNQLRSLFVKHESESSSDGEGPSNSAKKGASTAVSKMSPRKGPAAPSSHQIFTEENNNEIRLLCQKFVLGGRSVNSDKKCAADLKREIAKLNAPHENYNLKTELVGAIDHRPTLFQYIEYLERTDIKSQELSSRSGDATLNENSSYEFRKEAYIFRRFIIDRGYSIDNITELTVERLIGSLLKGLIAADNVTDHDNASMSFPVHMLAMASGLRPDKYVRASKNYLNWDKGLLPVVFAEECKPRKNLNEDTCAQLAASLHPSLVILVLYYLDTRTSLMSPLPPWLFLYGIVYTEKGVIIWAHYPTIKHDTTNQTSAWKFRSSLITRKYEDAFDDTTNAGSRIQLLAALLKIRSHSLYVLEQLKVWEGRGRLILNGLLPQIQ
ncbi:hypothetical protein CPB86DRAFT_183763 [Serendipita vermifera]|nr:hypothetical protein CPB86DRAFT_183763 [Serendipita vermifera]